MIQRSWLIDDSPSPHPGCFVIPSYALKNSSLPTQPTRAQIELAFEWWKKFPDAKLILSTGDNQRLGIPNSRVMAEYAVSLGLPRESVIEEDRSWNTYTNLLYSMQIIEARHLGPRRWSHWICIRDGRSLQREKWGGRISIGCLCSRRESQLTDTSGSKHTLALLSFVMK